MNLNFSLKIPFQNQISYKSPNYSFFNRTKNQFTNLYFQNKKFLLSMYNPSLTASHSKSSLILNTVPNQYTQTVVDTETLKLRERLGQLEKEMIDVLVEIENKDSIIDNLQRWKSLLAMLNSPQYSGVSIEINKVSAWVRSIVMF